MISIDIKSRTPIYEQLYENTRKLILEGQMTENQKLPSVRELASLLTINPNTIQKAYKQLENEGYIYVTRGRGNFVNKVNEQLIDQQAIEIQKSLCRLVEEATILGVDKKGFLEMAGRCFEEEK